MIKLSLYFKGKLLKVHQPKSGSISIGRDSGSDIAIDNLGISPLHALITLNGETALIEDKSEPTATETPVASGLIINNQKVTRHHLQHNDQVMLGKYTLKFTREADQEELPVVEAFPSQERSVPAWLQFLSGPKVGRTVKLLNPMVRLGKTGKTSAMISSRNGQYFIAHLEGEPRTRVQGRELDNERHDLNDGDRVQVGETEMLFFLEK